MKLFDRKQWNAEQKKSWHHCLELNADECRFCNIEDDDIAELIIWKWKHWYICHNKYPILSLENHLMVIPYEHVIDTKDISPEAFAEMPIIENFMREIYGEEDYFSFVRQSITGRSLAHIHYHYLPGKMYYEALERMLSGQGY